MSRSYSRDPPTTHRGHGFYPAPWKGRRPTEETESDPSLKRNRPSNDLRWPKQKQPSFQLKGMGKQEPSCEPNPSFAKSSKPPSNLSFCPPAREDILFMPPSELTDFIPDARIMISDGNWRNDTTLTNLLSLEFMRGHENAPALKFLIRILSRMLTQKKWTVYYVSYLQAYQQSREKYDNYSPPHFVKLEKNSCTSYQT